MLKLNRSLLPLRTGEEAIDPQQKNAICVVNLLNPVRTGPTVLENILGISSRILFAVAKSCLTVLLLMVFLYY